MENKYPIWQSRIYGFGIIALAFGIIGLIVVLLNEPPKYNDLLNVNGIVNSIEKVSKRKAGTKVYIILQSDKGAYNIHADDEITELISRSIIKQRDSVDVWIVKDNLWRDFYWLWQLKRNNSTIVSYDQAYKFEKRQRDIFMIISFVLSGVGISIVTIFIVLSKKRSNSNGGNLTSASS